MGLLSSVEGDVLPSDDEGVFGSEDLGADHPFKNIRAESLAEFHAELVLPRLEIPFHAEVDAGLLQVGLVAPEKTDSAFGEEGTHEARVVVFRPRFGGEVQRVTVDHPQVVREARVPVQRDLFR